MRIVRTARFILQGLALLTLLVIGGSIQTKNALAYASYTTFSMPSVSTPAYAIAHGDGSVTIADGDCPTYENNPTSTANSAVTLNSSGSSIDAIKKISNGKQTQACLNWVAAGADGTLYGLQVGTSPYPYQIMAARDNTILWVTSFSDPAGCNGRKAHIFSPTMGLDGNLYLHLDWTYVSPSCPEKEALASISPATGDVRFAVSLPSTGRNYLDTSVSSIMPYNGGVAVLNGATTSFSILFYDNSGNAITADTWTPTLSGADVKQVKIDPATGRIFLLTEKYASPSYVYTLSYKDTNSSTVTTLAAPTGASFSDIYATPSDGVVASWVISASNKGFSYYDSSGSQLYQTNVMSETGAIVSAWNIGGITVDDSGNVIVRKQIDDTVGDSDRNIIVDSYDSSGTKTRLFNSSQMATGSLDSFTSTSYLPQSIGGGKLYMTLCHATGSYTSTCTSSYSPVVLAISLSSTYDYARAAAFNEELSSTVNYVALGDSYSSGEGNPPFMTPTDGGNGGDGCDRSFSGYPVLLTQEETSLRLRAFRACSGATTTTVVSGHNGETDQLDSLNASTGLVTITIGGNDVFFGDFAFRCVAPFGSCDSSSQEYIDTMDAIANDLPDELDTMYAAIRTAAPNATIAVVGYPQVVPASGYLSCGGWTFTNSEQDAARDVGTALDDAISDAVSRAGSGFTYIDPDASGSPFLGHELCTTDPYFNGVSTPSIFSFHPNAEGEQAYADLIASYF